LRVPDLYQAIWRHKIFVALMTLFMVSATWFVTSKQEKIYTASTLIRVEQAANNPGDVINSLEAGQRLARTYAMIAGTRTIRDQIFNELRGTVSLNRIDVSAQPVADLELLTVSASHPSPRLAWRVANAAPAAISSFVKRSGANQEHVIVVEKARIPSSPSSPRLKLNVALALVLGLILNSFLALISQILRDPLPSGVQLEELIGLPVLATVPRLEFIGSGTGRLRGKRKGPTARDVSGQKPDGGSSRGGTPARGLPKRALPRPQPQPTPTSEEARP
jgi:capsular polysaccharide biosynthesis protein